MNASGKTIFLFFTYKHTLSHSAGKKKTFHFIQSIMVSCLYCIKFNHTFIIYINIFTKTTHKFLIIIKYIKITVICSKTTKQQHYLTFPYIQGSNPTRNLISARRETKVSQKLTEVSMQQILLKKNSHYTWKEQFQVFR